MTIKLQPNGFVLSTGRSVDANCRLVSIPILPLRNDNIFEFGEGYDGHVSLTDPKNGDYYTKYSITWVLSIPEGIEICSAMIEAWQTRKRLLEAT